MLATRTLSLSKQAALLLRETISEWNEDGASGIAASLAYYTIFSLSPLLILIALLLGLVLDQTSIQTGLVDGVRSAVGDGGAEFMLNLIRNRQSVSGDLIGTVIWISVVIWGASGLFAQLQNALNKIWEVRPVPGRSPTAILKARFFSFVLVMVVSFILLLTMVANTTISAVLYNGQHDTAALFIRPLQFVITLIMTTFLIAAVFKILPDVLISWHDLWVGAGVTAFLFFVGQWAVGLYLSRANVGSVFGAAGSLTAILVWIYYSAQILLLGAEFTEVWARRYGHYIRPDEDAMWVNESKARAEAEEAKVAFHEVDSDRAKLDWVAEDRRRRVERVRQVAQRVRRPKPEEADTDETPLAE